MRSKVDSGSPSSEDYKIAFEEYKMLLDWTNDLANRRQETNNLFFGMTGALLTVTTLALTQLTGTPQGLALIILALIGIIVAIVWASLLQRYRELLRFKYSQLELFEKILGLESSGLVTAEKDFFRFGKPLEINGKKSDLVPPTRLGRFGITLAERNMALVFLAIFGVFLIIGIIYWLG